MDAIATKYFLNVNNDEALKRPVIDYLPVDKEELREAEEDEPEEEEELAEAEEELAEAEEDLTQAEVAQQLIALNFVVRNCLREIMQHFTKACFESVTLSELSSWLQECKCGWWVRQGRPYFLHNGKPYCESLIDIDLKGVFELVIRDRKPAVICKPCRDKPWCRGKPPIFNKPSKILQHARQEKNLTRY